MSFIETLYGLTEDEVRVEVLRRASNAILAKYPDIEGCNIEELAQVVLDATVENEDAVDDVMPAYLTLTGWR